MICKKTLLINFNSKPSFRSPTISPVVLRNGIQAGKNETLIWKIDCLFQIKKV